MEQLPMIQTAKRQTTQKREVVSTLVVDTEIVQILAWVCDLASFRRWYHSDDFPESGRICYLNGEVWVDMSMEQVFSHNQVKGEYTRVLAGLAKTKKIGRFFPDGIRITNVEADLSCCPDGVFVSRKRFQSGQVRLIERAKEGFLELEGTPDMTLEVLSPSTVTKDTETLFDQYWRAGIPEYWLVDARGDRLDFDIFQHTAKGYTATRKQGGWIKSAVFGKSFRLTRRNDELGHPEYTLAVR
jgi:Uma2 family endonuclease